MRDCHFWHGVGFLKDAGASSVWKGEYAVHFGAFTFTVLLITTSIKAAHSGLSCSVWEIAGRTSSRRMYLLTRITIPHYIGRTVVVSCASYGQNLL